MAFIPDYYWRDYTGTIPADAIPVESPTGEVYIGQAFLNNGGLMVATIKPGVRDVSVAFYEPKTLDKHIKILCGPKANFAWIAKGDNLQETVGRHHAVIGGHEICVGDYYVGKILVNGEVQVAKVATFHGAAPLVYLQDEQEVWRDSNFEILINRIGLDER